jgi:RNA polymerase sigma-70 factor (ECF subfamily)
MNKTKFDKLFIELYEKLCNYAYSILNDYDLAEDIVQDMYAKVWMNRTKREVKKIEKSYYYKSIHNSCLDYIKHNKIKDEYRDEFKILNSISYNDSIVDFELVGRVDEAIEQLPEKSKEAFKLSRYEGLKYREIATKMNISENTVDTHIRKSLKSLKIKLKEFIS